MIFGIYYLSFHRKKIDMYIVYTHKNAYLDAGSIQEFFLVDEEFFYRRPDLVTCGRTLFGTRPPKGQEMDDHYFGSIPERVLEYMNEVSGDLPEGINPTLGPDATGVGWVYEYALVDRTGQHDLAGLRSIQDWYLRYELMAISGVSEVASAGGFVRQNQFRLRQQRPADSGTLFFSL